MMADLRATVDAMSKAERDHLIQLGLFAEGFKYPDMLMADAVAKILASPSTIAELSILLPPLIKIGNLTESLQQLSILLETVPHDNSLVKIYTSTSIMNVITFIIIGLRIYSRTKITKKMWPEDWWAVASIVCSPKQKRGFAILKGFKESTHANTIFFFSCIDIILGLDILPSDHLHYMPGVCRARFPYLGCHV